MADKTDFSWLLMEGKAVHEKHQDLRLEGKRSHRPSNIIRRTPAAQH